LGAKPFYRDALGPTALVQRMPDDIRVSDPRLAPTRITGNSFLCRPTPFTL
jgi:hypothetical protein